MPEQIPKITHQIWVGTNPIPQKALDYRKKMIDLHPGWNHMLWTDMSLKRSGLNVNKTYYLSSNTGHKSDILRYQLMYTYGGIYLDMDIDMQKNMNELRNNSAFVIKNPQVTIDVIPEEVVQNAVLGSCPKNVFFSFLLGQLYTWCVKSQRRDLLITPSKSENCVTVKTGPIFLSLMIKRFNEFSGKNSIKILPSETFYPYSSFWKEEDRSFPMSFGIHRWWGTWAQ
jgi:mannosyltransferase OCH1-like enzyme